jgi:starch synthase
MNAIMKVLFAVSEIYPVIKTGGLGDVAGALPVALGELGVDVRVMVPAYPAMLDAVEELGEPVSLGDPLGAGETRLILGRLPQSGIAIWLVHCPALYDRPAGPYLDAIGRDWPDNHLRFAVLARAAATVCDIGSLLGWRPDVLHAHDWHAGLAPAFLHLRGGRRPASVMTIHNLAFQGNFPATVLGQVGLPPECFCMDGVEFHNQVSFLKAGIRYSDRVTTVSPTYAREILTPILGCGFDGILRQRNAELRGILNGIDYRAWDPATDPFIARTYDASQLGRKDANKRAVAERLGLAATPEAPLIGVVSRLTDQKGVDLILSAVPNLLAMGARLAVVGSGDAPFEEAFQEAATAHPGRVGVWTGYDEPLAHLVQAGADLLLVPSRFEPCGLTQLAALRYGTVPVVRRTGGLADTVVDASHGKEGTGFVFEAATSLALSGAVSRALAAYRKRTTWRTLQRCAMEQDFSWTRAAQEYLDLYRDLAKGRPRRPASGSRKRK